MSVGVRRGGGALTGPAGGRVAPPLLRVIGSAIFAAAVLWLADCAVMARLGKTPPGAGYLPLALVLLSSGAVLLAILEWLLMVVSGRLAARAARTRIVRLILRGVLIALFCAPVIVPVSLAAFSGAGVSRWRWAPVAPWITVGAWMAIVVLAVAVCVSVAERWRSRPGARTVIERLIAAVLLSGALLCALGADILVYPQLYRCLHLTAMLGIAVGCQLLLFAVLPPDRAAGGPRRRAFIVLVILLLVSPALVFPLFLRGNSQRVFAWELPYYHRKTVELVHRFWDRDRDGFSPVLGGGDPDDGDPLRGPFTVSAVPGPERGGGWAAGPPDPGLRKKIKKLVRETSRHSILLITIDALRADRVNDPSCAEGAAPWMRDMRGRSVVFENCFAPSAYTVVSMGGVFFSRLCPWQGDTVPPSLTERLRDAGYETVRVMNPSMKSGERINYLARGFNREVFIGHNRWDREWTSRLMDGELAGAVIREIEGLAGKRFFIWVHFEDLHEWPYLSPSLFPGTMSAREKYDYIALRSNEEVARLLGSLKELGREDGTIVVISSDHGQGLGEHNIMTHTQYLYNALVHVPLVISVPGLPPAEVGENVSLLDLAPTLLELAGRRPAADALGISLVPALVGGRLPEARPLVALESRQRSVIEGPWKLIVTPAASAVELYNIKSDPGERRDLSGDPALRRVRDRLLGELAPYWGVKVKGPAS